jgi:hypothetical protein
MEELLRDIVSAERSVNLRGMRSHFLDPTTCDSACYDCLRSYQNMRFHGILDWRLAMDVASLLAGSAPPATPGPRWSPLVQRALSSLPNLRPFEAAGLPAAAEPETGTVAVFSHPLLSRYPSAQRAEPVADAHVAAEEKVAESGGAILHFSFFDLVHRPWWVVGQVFGGKSGDPNDEAGDQD